MKILIGFAIIVCMVIYAFIVYFSIKIASWLFDEIESKIIWYQLMKEYKKEQQEMKDRTINILGTRYEIIFSNKDKDKLLNDCDGYCDKTTKKIVIDDNSKDSDLGDYECYQRKVLRHEIIHAFLNESGLNENWEHNKWGQEETTVDWFALQSPKIYKVFEQLDILE